MMNTCTKEDKIKKPMTFGQFDRILNTIAIVAGIVVGLVLRQ